MENIDVISIAIGFAVAVVLMAIKGFFDVRKYKKELTEYKGHLATQMKITQEGTKNITEESEKLKKENENLRITVKTLGQKPGRNELRLLNVYDAALRKMMIKAPGFAQGWEMSLQEAEREYEENEVGIKTVVKRVFGPSITHKNTTED
jgi:Holliday junction resolvasome RuvABC ATP-dependent DNA helicase subunit